MGDLAGIPLGDAMGRDRGRPESDVPSWQTDVQTAYTMILADLPVDLAGDGLVDTPVRAARAWADLTAGYHVDVPGLFTTFDAERYDELVVVGGIQFYSLCEHHLLPFHGTVGVGYIPNGRVVGLSKIARLVDAYARRLQVQERLTQQVADTMMEHLDAKGVIVIAQAEHLCMSMRGVRSPATTTTSVVRGALKDDARARSEALALLGATT